MSGRLDLNNEIPSGKKIGPAVPPKPKKSQPLVNIVFLKYKYIIKL